MPSSWTFNRTQSPKMLEDYPGREKRSAQTPDRGSPLRRTGSWRGRVAGSANSTFVVQGPALSLAGRRECAGKEAVLARGLRTESKGEAKHGEVESRSQGAFKARGS